MPPCSFMPFRVLGIFPRETWTRLLTEAGFGRVMMAKQPGRDVFQAIAA